MLKSPNRPRAPSAATLRVLYQLAYISSGTAVGIGALCAEERRRRTQIVQKIADNAKRIRQSPRYAHGAAAAAVKRRDFEDNFGWFGQEGEDGTTQNNDEADSVKSGTLENHGGVKMPELPSVVEEEYGRLIEGNHKKSKRRKRNRRPDFVEEHGSRETVAKAEVDTRGDRQARTTTTTSLNSRTCVPPRLENSSKSITLQDDDKTKSWYWMSYKRPMRYGVPQEGDLKAEIARRKLFHATEEGKAYKTSDDDYTTII